MGLLHGLLLVFSFITIAPLMIVFSMTLPTTAIPDEPDTEVLPVQEALPTRRRRPRALQEAPSQTRQLAPAPLSGHV
jgi:hypothetical protein